MTDAESDWLNELRASGFTNAIVVRRCDDIDAFDNSIYVFDIGGLILRFTRDRGEDWIDICESHECSRSYEYDDIAIALGWRSVASIVARKRPMPVGAIIGEIKDNFMTLVKLFSPEQMADTRALVSEANRSRREAFRRHLAGLTGS